MPAAERQIVSRAGASVGILRALWSCYLPSSARGSLHGTTIDRDRPGRRAVGRVVRVLRGTLEPIFEPTSPPPSPSQTQSEAPAASPAGHDDDDRVGGVRRRDDGLLLHNPDSLTAASHVSKLTGRLRGPQLDDTIVGRTGDESRGDRRIDRPVADRNRCGRRGARRWPRRPRERNPARSSG